MDGHTGAQHSELSKEQIIMIEMSLQDLEENKVISHKELFDRERE